MRKWRISDWIGLWPRIFLLSPQPALPFNEERDSSIPGLYLQFLRIKGQEGVQIHVNGHASISQVLQILCWSSTLKTAQGTPGDVQTLPALLGRIWRGSGDCQICLWLRRNPEPGGGREGGGAPTQVWLDPAVVSPGGAGQAGKGLPGLPVELLLLGLGA